MTNLRQQISTEEWGARTDLAAFFRLVAGYGWDDLLLAHISARLPDGSGYLVNPYGQIFSEVTASSILKVDFFGHRQMPSDFEISPEANVIHGAILESRPDINCVAHIHTVAGTAVSSQENGLLNISQQSMIVHMSLAYHDYQGVVLDPAEGPDLQKSLGDKQHMIMRNHGLLAVGATVGKAFYALYNLQRSCEMQVASQGNDVHLITITDAIMERTRKMFGGHNVRNPETKDLLWEAKLRELRQTSPDFEN
ncbi:MAG: class II aldolase [Alphaproteobacteria bacterium]|nr:class II aldolase [Alphaproteobacteria bacterium]